MFDHRSSKLRTKSTLKPFSRIQDSRRADRSRSLFLFKAISAFSDCHCSDPRDRVCGLLGVLRRHERIDLDYILPLRAVLFAALSNVLECESELSLGKMRDS